MSLDLDGFFDFSLVPVLFLIQDFCVLQGACVTGGFHVLFNSRCCALPGCVLFEANSKVPSCLSDVITIAVLAMNMIDQTTLVFFLYRIFWIDHQAFYGVERLVVRRDVMIPEEALQIFR